MHAEDLPDVDVMVGDCSCGKRVAELASHVDGFIVCPNCANPVVTLHPGTVSLSQAVKHARRTRQGGA